MGDIPEVWQEPIVPRVTNYIRKPDLTETETSPQDNPSMQETEVYSGICEMSPVFLAKRMLQRPRNKAHSFNSHHCQVYSVPGPGTTTKMSSEGKLERDSRLAESMPESSRFKENDLKSDHKPVASPLAEEENASTDFGAQEK
jgi:hypothetical protein